MQRIPIVLMSALVAPGLVWAQPADLTGRWVAAPLVDHDACVIYRRTGTIDLRPGKSAGSYVGEARFTIQRIATGEPGCTNAPGTVKDRVQVSVGRCASGRVPGPGDLSWPSVKPCLDVTYRGSRLGIAYASETWHLRGAAVHVWGPRFAKPFALTRATR